MSLSDLSIIGCRVSIISKAKIRYEGYLHSIDSDTPEEPVITLSKVWSFGTEDRPCERPVAARDEEYNRVVFRGRDLDDLRVIHSSVFLNEDSAIVSAAPGSPVPHPHSSATTESINRIDNFGAGRIPARGPDISPNDVLKPLSLDSSNQKIRPNASPFQLPIATSRPGPIGTVLPDSLHAPDSRGPRPFGDGRSDIDPDFFNTNKRTVYSSRPTAKPVSSESNKSRAILSSTPYTGFPSHSWDNRDRFLKKGGLYKGTSNYGYSQNHQRDRRGGYSNQWVSHRGNKNTYGYHNWGGRPGHQGWNKVRSGVPQSAAQSNNFSKEYDYEAANAELAVVLEKINITPKPGSTTGSTELIGDKSNDGSSTTEEAVCYDKNKSFFDTLSSEMMDRANGLNPQGMNRRDERVLNSATFGTVVQQYSRRTDYGGPRSYGYGQRRPGNSNGGNYWQSGGKNFTSNASNSLLPTTERVG